MKKYIYLAIAAIVAISMFFNVIEFSRVKKLKEDIENLRTVEWAYELENSNLKNKSIQANYTIGMLTNSKDSLIVKLDSVRRQLKIKDKEIKSLSYIASTAQIKDTLIIRDTIFKANTDIDTTLHNKWYDIGLTLKYPNIIGTDISVPSKKYVIASFRKVTINPSRCGFINLFKKKQKIVEVEIVEENPYITNNQQKFINIVP